MRTSKPKSKSDVFIIESLSFDDENEKLHEGEILSNILKLNGKEPIYYYIRTANEFDHILDIFENSKYRYLHLSCHGSENSMQTTLDSIGFDELEAMLAPCLDYRRLFLSACSMVNESLATKLMANTKCHSVIGPGDKVAFTDSAIFWASFYHLMFVENFESMVMKDIQSSLKKLAALFDVPINYYSSSTENKQGYSFRKIKV